MGRTEMLRAQGYTYKAFEDAGLFMVVAEASCRYLAAAEYDDRLNVGHREHLHVGVGADREGEDVDEEVLDLFPFKVVHA